MDEPLPAAELGIPRSGSERRGARRGPRAEPPIARGSGRGASAFLGLRRRARCLSGQPVRSPPGGARGVKRKRSSWMGGAVAISHYVKPPSKAALLLIAKHGAADARKHALQERGSARRARSRLRFTFWATVIAEIDAHYDTGFVTLADLDRRRAGRRSLNEREHGPSD